MRQLTGLIHSAIARRDPVSTGVIPNASISLVQYMVQAHVHATPTLNTHISPIRIYLEVLDAMNSKFPFYGPTIGSLAHVVGLFLGPSSSILFVPLV